MKKTNSYQLKLAFFFFLFILGGGGRGNDQGQKHVFKEAFIK